MTSYNTIRFSLEVEENGKTFRGSLGKSASGLHVDFFAPTNGGPGWQGEALKAILEFFDQVRRYQEAQR